MTASGQGMMINMTHEGAVQHDLARLGFGSSGKTGTAVASYSWMIPKVWSFRKEARVGGRKMR